MHGTDMERPAFYMQTQDMNLHWTCICTVRLPARGKSPSGLALMKKYPAIAGWARLKKGCIRHGVPEHEDPSTASCEPEDAPLAMLHDLAQELRVPWANAWSLNVVYAQPVNVKRAGYALLGVVLSSPCFLVQKAGIRYRGQTH